MSDTATVRLMVVDKHGAPVEGALVSVLRSTVAFPEIALVSDADGMVRLPLQKGRYVLGAVAGSASGEIELDATDNLPTGVLRLPLTRAGG